MNNILFSELDPDFLIQGLGLHPDERHIFTGKVGRQEIQLLPTMNDVLFDEKNTKIYSVGFAESSQSFRTGDILMTGSDDLLDRAFQVMDEIEQRCVVVTLIPTQDATHLYLLKEELAPSVHEWRNCKASFLCLWVVGPIDSGEQAKLATILRKILLMDTE